MIALSRRWSDPELAYRSWSKGDQDLPFELGAVQFVQVEPLLWIANMVAQRGIYMKKDQPPIRYEALQSCLIKVRDEAQRIGASVHAPRIGAGLAGGRWSIIEGLIEETLCSAGVDTFIYDLPKHYHP